MEGRHVREAGRLHQAAFPNFFLSLLGLRFLNELYKAYAFGDSGVALAVENSEDGRLIGIAAGTLEPEGFFRKLLIRRWWVFGLLSLPSVVMHPGALRRVFRALRYRGDSPRDKNRALLSSIAIMPGEQGTGLGSALLRAWVARAREKGAKGCYLTTDADLNDAVNRFYAGNGWRIFSEFVTPESRRMNVYVLDWE